MEAGVCPAGVEATAGMGLEEGFEERSHCVIFWLLSFFLLLLCFLGARELSWVVATDLFELGALWDDLIGDISGERQLTGLEGLAFNRLDTLVTSLLFGLLLFPVS